MLTRNATNRNGFSRWALHRWFGKKRRPRPTRLNIAGLEDRTVPATFTVQTLANTGTNSLRDCIAKANAAPGADTVDFAAGLTGQIVLTTGQIVITDGITISGPGASVLSISGNDSTRIFDWSTAHGAAISLSGLTLTHSSSGGGAVYGADQLLTISNCIFADNTANLGAAIDVFNSAALSASSVTLNNCAFTGNKSTGSGGVLDLFRSHLSVNNCTFFGNSAKYNGGAINFDGNGEAVNFTVNNSTISSNGAAATGEGGAIWIHASGASMNIRNSTIVGNSAGSKGGGISLYGALMVLNIDSSVVSGNVCITGPDIGSDANVKVNSSAVGSPSGFTLIGSNNLAYQPYANLLLGPIANNGGIGMTHAPQAGSPLINKGSNPASLSTDGRGTGFVRSNGQTDIGAVEDQHSFVVTNNNDAGTGSLRQALLCANSNPGADTVTFDANYFNTPRTIGLTSGELPVGDAVAIVGPGASLATIHGNNLSRVFNTSSAADGAAIAFSGLTITGGKTPYNGGGIYIGEENVSLANCAVTNNWAGEDGGGINVESKGGTTKGALQLIGSTVSGNTAIDAGGGLYFYNGISFACTNSTIANNSATGGVGGGIYFFGPVAAGGLTIQNTTISSNTGGSGGGAVFVSFFGNANFQNCTITNNKATTGGGGLAEISGSGSITLNSTIVSGNNNASSPDILSSNSVIANYSALGSLAGFSPNGSNNLTVGVDLKLGPLANNGGTTLTHVPLPGSPLINAGSNIGGLSTDQRGAGWIRAFGQTDIGAVEAQNSFVVTNINSSGAGSLQQALATANANPGADTITFDPNVFTSFKTISVTNGELAVNDAVSVLAPFTGVMLNASSLTRVVNTYGAPTDAAIVFENFAFTGGKGTGDGGAIYIGDEDVTIRGSLVYNSAASQNGGGIAIAQGAGSLTLEDSAIQSNSATAGDGGDIYAGPGSTITIRRTSVRSGTAAGSGGGIFFANGGSLTIEDSTLSGNTANESVGVRGGGGIYFYGAAGKFMVSNSTLSGNKAATSTGGAVNLRNFTGTAEFRNCTVTANSASVNGGGIARTSGTGGVMLSSSIVAGNTNANMPDMSFNASTTITGNNTLVGVADVGLMNFGGSGILLGTKASPLDAKLAPLADNGGPTQTHALLTGSPAINAGNNAYSLSSDQRGAGHNRVSGPAVDIGAFESTSPAVISSVVINNGDAQRSRVTEIKINFDQPVFIAGPAAFELRRQGDNALVGLNVSPVGTTTTVTLTFNGALSQSGSLADGRYTLTAFGSQISNGNGSLDGDHNGAGGDDYVLVGDPATNKLVRLFGDADGNGLVDGLDFGAFRSAFNTNSSTFDFDGNGIVDGLDFGQFRTRFGMMI